MSMTQEETTIQNLNEEELEYALQNAKQQVEVINESLKLTESRTKLLISFLVAAIAFAIPVVVSNQNSAYFRLFCGLIIASYIIEVLIIVHCYFLKEFHRNSQEQSWCWILSIITRKITMKNHHYQQKKIHWQKYSKQQFPNLNNTHGKELKHLTAV